MRFSAIESELIEKSDLHGRAGSQSDVLTTKHTRLLTAVIVAMYVLGSSLPMQLFDVKPPFGALNLTRLNPDLLSLFYSFWAVVPSKCGASRITMGTF